LEYLAEKQTQADVYTTKLIDKITLISIRTHFIRIPYGDGLQTFQLSKGFIIRYKFIN
jgi:hypothetical protein